MKFLVITDLHYGNPRIDYDRLDASLGKYFFPRVHLSDVVFIAGDTFDNLINLTTVGAKYFFKFLLDLKEACKINNTKLRVLRGTIIHDRNQPEVFLKIADSVDVKVISTPTIEIIDGISICYLPDNLPFTDPSEAAEWIRKNSEEPLHLGIFHGMFDFVMPQGIDLPHYHYTKDTFDGLFSSVIFSGHIHTGGRLNQERGTIYHVPTFERFSHGEEGRKGFVSGEIFSDGSYQLEFIKNLDAQVFKSCRLYSTTVESAVNEIETFISKYYPDKSGGLQVISDIPEIKQILSSVFRDRYPFIKLSFKKKKIDKKEIISFIPEDLPIFDTKEIVPTEDNLPVLIFEYLSAIKANRVDELSVEEIDRLLTILSDK